MTTAIIGTGNVGGTLARHLVGGREPVVLAAKDDSHAAALAQELGELARAASVEDAIAEADAVVFAVWLDTTKELIAADARLLENKVVVDPSNPLGFDESGQMIRTLPEGQSSGSVVAALLPAGAHYVKGFGTLGADTPRERSKSRAAAGRGLLRHRRRQGRGDDRTPDPCRRLRAIEGGRPRRCRTARGAWRRPPPRWRLERPARRSRPSAWCHRCRAIRMTQPYLHGTEG